MIFRDAVSLSKPVKGTYSDSNTGELHTVRALVALTNGVRRGGLVDALAGDATAYLDPNDAWMRSIGYKIEGFFLTVEKFSVSRTYKVMNVAIGERHATDGSVSHIEVELEEVK